MEPTCAVLLHVCVLVSEGAPQPLLCAGMLLARRIPLSRHSRQLRLQASHTWACKPQSANFSLVLCCLLAA